MTKNTNQKLGAYDTHQRSTQTNRDTDKRALLTFAGRLKDALEDGGKNMKLYEDAIRINQKLWTIFQVALCNPENELPKRTKIELLNVSRYVDRVSFSAIANFSASALTSLIEINRTIAAGLAKTPPGAQSHTVQSMPPMPEDPNAVKSVMISA